MMLSTEKGVVTAGGEGSSASFLHYINKERRSGRVLAIEGGRDERMARSWYSGDCGCGSSGAERRWRIEGVWKAGGSRGGLKPPWMAEEGRRWVQIGQICF